MTPFKIVYDIHPPQIIRYVLHPKHVASVQEKLLLRDEVIAKLKNNLARAQQAMKKYANQKRRDFEFKVGDKVLVKIQPYRQHSIALRKNKKLSLRYFGPFSIIEKIGPMAYKLLLPEATKIHSVFHASVEHTYHP